MASILDPDVFMYSLIYKFRLEKWLSRYFVYSNVIQYVSNLIVLTVTQAREENQLKMLFDFSLVKQKSFYFLFLSYLVSMK